MRRADRLFRIVEHLKARRKVVRAEDLAEEFEVSVRTIYRDMADLISSRIPIVGEAGVGYMMDHDYVLRPLMFSPDELDAIMLGANMVGSWKDQTLSSAAKSAMDKISAVLPGALREEIDEAVLFSFPGKASEAITIDFGSLRKAVKSKNIVTFQYKKEDGEISFRRIKPLALAHFSPVWLLMGWEDRKQDFRNFRLDRISELNISDEKFKDEKGMSLRDFLQREKV